jgi:hypothetical protein
VYLHLEDVETEGAPGIVWEVRMGPGGGGGDPEEAVGAVSFFGRGHAHGDPAKTPGVGGERFITDAVDRLAAAGRWDDEQDHSLVPPRATRGLQRERTPTVRVGGCT